MMEYREVELIGGGHEDDDGYVATNTGTREPPPPPLTHDDNCGFLRMLREEKERYVRAYEDYIYCTYESISKTIDQSVMIELPIPDAYHACMVLHYYIILYMVRDELVENWRSSWAWTRRRWTCGSRG
jgi:hypothetical protein